jgi:hypothetical protein
MGMWDHWIVKPTEMIEGPEAYKRFENAMRAVLAVPHSFVQARIAEHKRQADANPRKRGPKRKVNPSASPVSAS